MAQPVERLAHVRLGPCLLHRPPAARSGRPGRRRLGGGTAAGAAGAQLQGPELAAEGRQAVHAKVLEHGCRRQGRTGDHQALGGCRQQPHAQLTAPTARSRRRALQVGAARQGQAFVFRAPEREARLHAQLLGVLERDGAGLRALAGVGPCERHRSGRRCRWP